MRQDEVLDCSGHLCPAPILMTEEKIAELAERSVLKVIFTDPGAKPDLEAWCRATGNELIGFRDEKNRYLIWVRKASGGREKQ